MKEVKEILENSFAYQNGEDISWEEVESFMKEAYNQAIQDAKDSLYYSTKYVGRDEFETLDKLKKK